MLMSAFPYVFQVCNNSRAYNMIDSLLMEKGKTQERHRISQKSW